MRGHAGRRVGHTDDRRIAPHDRLAGLRHLAVAAPVSSHVDDNGTRTHVIDHLCGDEDRRLATGDGRRRDDHVGGRHDTGERLLLLSLLLGGQLTGIATRSLGGDAEVNEGRAEALCLLLGCGPDVVGAHIGTETTGRGDGLEAGNTNTHDEHLCGRDGARSRHEHREELRQALGGQESSSVARHGCLRAERVHRLRPADPRQQVKAHRRGVLGRQDLQGLDRLGRLEEAEHEHPVGVPVRLIDGWGVDLDDHASTVHRRGCVWGNAGAGVDERLVREGRLIAGARLDDNVPALGNQLLGNLRDQSDTALAGARLCRDGKNHGAVLTTSGVKTPLPSQPGSP